MLEAVNILDTSPEPTVSTGGRLAKLLVLMATEHRAYRRRPASSLAASTVSRIQGWLGYRDGCEMLTNLII